MKSHKTIQVTAALLREMGACQGALKDLHNAGMLPCTISTDPEANMARVLRLLDKQTDGYAADVGWLSRWFFRMAVHGDEYANTTDVWNNDKGVEFPHNDVIFPAQLLAAVADALLTRRGK